MNISGGDSAEDPAASPSLLDERVEKYVAENHEIIESVSMNIRE